MKDLTNREVALLVEGLLLLRNVAELPRKGKRAARSFGRTEVDKLLLKT